jgi:hypothetical protein
MPAGADCVEANNIITCRLDVLAVGTDFSIRIPVTIVSGPYLTNQVSIASDNSELAPADNIVSLVTPLEGVPPLDEPVTLSAVLVGGNLQLSWPASATGMILETAAAVGSAAPWQVVNATPVVINGRNVVSQNTSGSAGFYRLRKL